MADGKSRGVVLVIEGDAIFALDLEYELRAEGFEVAGPFLTCEAAAGWLAHNTPDRAIVSAEMPEGHCLDAIRSLEDRSVPLVVTFGIHGLSAMPPVRASGFLERPVDLHRLMTALGRPDASRGEGA